VVANVGGRAGGEKDRGDESGGWSPASAGIVAQSRVRERVELVAAFWDRTDRRVDALAERADMSLHRRTRTRPARATLVVVAVGVVPGRDQHEFGRESFSGGDHTVLERREPRVLMRALWDRQVD
jgi:hypothetical protein